MDLVAELFGNEANFTWQQGVMIVIGSVIAGGLIITLVENLL